MDILWEDPAKWLILALVACVHCTWHYLRRQKGRIVLRYIPSIVISGLVAFYFFAPIPLVPEGLANYSPQSLYWLGIPALCGFALCLRNHSVAGRAVVMAMAVAFSSGLIRHRVDIQSRSREYMSDVPFWARGERPAPQLGDFIRSPKHGQKNWIEAGYLPPRHGGVDSASYYFNRPERLWHSPITGFYRRSARPYVLWTPGGAPLEAFRHARMIPIDLPEASVIGHEAEVGVPIGPFEWHEVPR